MSAQIRYAYLKGHTWLYRRNWPKDVAVALGQQALKQSLKTGDASTARVRAAEVNARYETLVVEVRAGAELALSDPQSTRNTHGWLENPTTALDHLRATLEHSGTVLERPEFNPLVAREKVSVRDQSRVYLNRRSNELRPGGFKSVRYSVGLFASKYGDRSVCSLTRSDGREFLGLIARLSPMIGKSDRTRGLTLDQLVAYSELATIKITARTQRRIWSQVNHWLESCVYEGVIEANPFNSVLFDQKVRPRPYAVPTDDEVARLLTTRDPLHPVLLTCLLSGMRAGEAVGLLREDLVAKGNLGCFVHVRPNELRLLKTDAAERLVPVHSRLDEVFRHLPSVGPLFPELTVNHVTKGFAALRRRLRLERPGLVFHSTRKWFVTQCERTGVPEHFTASLVGHQSARSENGLTYGIYSAGISDEQKRGIVDQIRLPTGTVAS
ncbi:integrase [Aliisedimentitalea scapharcae]|uniref:Integrase n=1 Tax=Aliisedimentitalea scapharcae TaxID=1524259 RepID=A0ABZ2XSI5_9RHOB